MRVGGISLVVLLGTLALLHLVWPPATTAAAVADPDTRAAKGFVTARTDRSLTVLAGRRQVLVVITSHTRVLGQRRSSAEIAPNDVVRVEGRPAAGNRLLADRIDVVLATDVMTVRRLPEMLTIDLLTVGI